MYRSNISEYPTKFSIQHAKSNRISKEASEDVAVTEAIVMADEVIEDGGEDMAVDKAGVEEAGVEVRRVPLLPMTAAGPTVG